MTKPPPPPDPPRPALLVQQDIRIAREDSEDPASRVVARVHCARNGCAMDVEDCAGCAHFARIETHEAGYVLLCRADDAPPARRDGLVEGVVEETKES